MANEMAVSVHTRTAQGSQCVFSTGPDGIQMANEYELLQAGRDALDSALAELNRFMVLFETARTNLSQ